MTGDEGVCLRARQTSISCSWSRQSHVLAAAAVLGPYRTVERLMIRIRIRGGHTDDLVR